MNVRLTKEQKIKILNSTDIYAVMQRILLREDKIDRNREHFWVIGLANNHRILFIEHISKGTVNSTLVAPMEVFSFALQKRAVRIVLCHNHPSGDLEPSFRDKNTTDRLIQTGLIVNTPVLDHLIISEESYLSFSDTGLMDELKKSTLYMPKYKEIQLIKEKAGEIERQKEKREIARAMKRKGMEAEMISELTGLPVASIKRLRIKKKGEEKTRGK